MGYSKKILIMSEVTKGFGTGAVKGVATIEQIGQRTKCTIDIFNLKDIGKGIFAFGVASDNSPVYVERLGMKGKISSTFGLGEIDMKGNIYCVLSFISEENVIPIAWGANNAKKLWETNILDGFKSIARPKMFAGKIEKVEPKKENYASVTVNPSKPQVSMPSLHSQQTVHKQPKVEEAQQNTSTKSIYDKLRNKDNKQFDSSTVLGRANTESNNFKPITVPKVTVAKISKVIDDAISDYQDERISDIGYYPIDIMPKDVLKESAAAVLEVKSAQSQKGFYDAFSQVPNELVDEYPPNTIKGSFYRPLKEDKKEPYQPVNNQIYEEPEQETIEQKFEPEQKVDVNTNPKYISSWGGYNNIRLKDIKESDDYKQELGTENANGRTVDNKKEDEQEDIESNYFESVKNQLDKLFEQSPPEDRLNKLMPDTYWVKVELAKNQYYVVGLIGEGPDYIGYGVPGIFSVNPPKELQGYCKWMAIDQQNPYGEGYWMMYQDADNGESINLELI